MFFIDKLSLTACLKAVILHLQNTRHTQQKSRSDILILDPVPTWGWRKVVLVFMNALGFQASEVHFDGGQLRTRDDTSVGAAARQMSNDVSTEIAGYFLNSSINLKYLNEKWGRNTLKLYTTKIIWPSLFHMILRILATDALMRKAGKREAILIISDKLYIARERLRTISPGIKIVFYMSTANSILAFLKEVGRLVFLHVKKIKRWMKKTLRLEGDGYNGLIDFNNGKASLLLLQEDDLSMDRSYRTQPHWLFPEDGPPPFQTVVLHTGNHLGTDDLNHLRSYGLFTLKHDDLYFKNKSRSSYSIKRVLENDFFYCLKKSSCGTLLEGVVLMSFCRLFLYAKDIADLCEYANVRTFMTCENYMIWSDAMQLVAKDLEIHTISYQYSNLRSVGPFMMTTADSMLTFSDLYQQRWRHHGIGPGEYCNIGYVFDSSFPFVKSRANELRTQLNQAGAEFVICYYDETMQDDKYGVMSRKNYESEVMPLFQYLLKDPSVGLIVKTQFKRHSPKQFNNIEMLMESVHNTGRYFELSHGKHRNDIFPAEAAYCADITIGNAVGSTASLEAAIAGVRSILLNPYGIKGANDSLYTQADIMYDSMEKALEAIKKFRKGMQEHIDLGDWSKIISQFDPFRDGRAASRIRKILTEKMVSNNLP